MVRPRWRPHNRPRVLFPFAVVATILLPVAIGASPVRSMPPRDAFAFVPNAGQLPEGVWYGVAGEKGELLVTDSGLQLSLVRADGEPPSRRDPTRRENVSRPFTVANIGIKPVGGDFRSVVAMDRLSGTASFFFGEGPTHWRTGLPRYARVAYRNIYSGIDLVVYGRGGEPEYDFIVNPGADCSVIEVEYTGIRGLVIDDQGDLLLDTPVGPVKQQRPSVYQDDGGQRRAVEGRYLLRGTHTVAFELGAYDRTKRLVIDPAVIYRLTDFGGWAIATDRGTGNHAYVAGLVLDNGTYDVSVWKINSSGDVIVHNVIVGDAEDRPYGIAVDDFGNAYVAGSTQSTNFPATPGTFGYDRPAGHVKNGFVVKVDPTGSMLTWATYLGGSSYDDAFAIAIDGSGRTYVTGSTSSDDFPVTFATAYQREKTTSTETNISFLSVINATATALEYSTYFGGTVSVFGGATQDYGESIVFDRFTEDVFIAGYTKSANFPFTAGVIQTQNGGYFDCFAARLRPTEAGDDSLVYSTYLGGTDADVCGTLAVDDQASAYIGGWGSANMFPPGTPVQGAPGGAVVAKINATATSYVYGYFLPQASGGDALGLAVDDERRAYVTGETTGSDYFFHIISPVGNQVVYSHFLSGPLLEGRAIALDPARNIHVTGADTLKYEGFPAPELEILPTTTRWKPKWSDDEIVIRFTGPSDLVTGPAAAMLEVHGPEGLLTIPPLVIEPDGTDYLVRWTGPFTYVGGTPPQTRRLPARNYPIRVLGTAGSSPTRSVQSGYYERVSLVEVKKLTLTPIAGGAPIDPNPAQGGGSRIFAEAVEEPTHWIPIPEPLDRVRVEVISQPSILDPGSSGPVIVHLRTYDVDDPSPPLVDDDSLPCNVDGCDNRGSPLFPGPYQNGYLSLDGSVWSHGAAGLALEMPTSGERSALFRASIRQGDNYRLAASTATSWLAGVYPEVSSDEGRLLHASSEVLSDGEQVSPLLTVWRNLYVEVDTMVSYDPPLLQRALEIASEFDTIDPSDTLNDPASLFHASYHGAGHEEDDGWKGANVSLAFHTHPNCEHDVTENTKSTLKAPPDLTNGGEPQTTRAYILRDDKIASLSDDVADFSLALELFARAYVRVRMDAQQAPDDLILFRPRLHRNLADFGSETLPFQKRSAATRWSVQFVHGFEGLSTHDADPRTEGSHLGETDEEENYIDGSTKQKSVMYLESIRDEKEKPDDWLILPDHTQVPLVLAEAELNERTTAHELLHTMSTSHDYAIMCYFHMIQANDPLGGTLTDCQVANLRDVEYPQRPLPISCQYPPVPCQ